MKITIELKINSTKIEMENSQMSLDLINPIFNDISDYSLPFSIPATPGNLSVLGIDNEINTFASSVTFDDAQLKIGEMILQGSILIDGSGPENSLSATFYSARSTFLTKVRGKYLTDIVYSEEIYADTATTAGWLAKARDSAYHQYPDYNYVFAPVWMPNYKDDVTGKVEPFVVNKWDKANNTFYYPAETGLRSSHFAPYFYLHFVIKKIFEGYGFAFSNEIRFTDWFMPSKDELKKMYTNLHAESVGGFEADDYWSSSELDDDQAHKCSFVDGTEDTQFKSIAYRIRACRSFISSDVYSLRDAGPAGGLIFDIVDNLDGTNTYYEAAPSDQSSMNAWSNVADRAVGTTGTAVGDGEDNTSDIINQAGGADDWFLPSKDELALMYTNLHLEGQGVFASQPYWSSSEEDAENSWSHNFGTGSALSSPKSSTFYVRACRKFTSETVYALRDTGPNGGLIFHIIEGEGSNEYYEAAAADQGSGQAWSNIIDTEIGTTGDSVGSGYGNTAYIINQPGHTDSAAKLCDDIDDVYAHTDSGAKVCDEYQVVDFGSDLIYNNPELRQLVIFHTNVEHFHLENADFAKHLPRILITDFIRLVEQKLNLRFIFSNHSGGIKIAFVNEILQQDPRLDLTRISSPRSRINLEKYDGFEIPVDVNSDNGGKSGDLKVLENSTFAQTVENLGDLLDGSDYGDLALVKNSEEIYQWTWNGIGADPSWQLLGSSFVSMKRDGNNVLSVTQDAKDLEMFSPVNDNISYVPRCDNERWLLPTREQAYEDLTLLFYRGMVPYNAVETDADLPVAPPDGTIYYVLDEDKSYIYIDPTWFDVVAYEDNGSLGTMDVNTYPLLTNSMYFRITDTYFAPFPGSSYSLSLFGDKGLYTKYWEKYIYWMLNIAKKEQRTVSFDENFLNNFEWDMIITIKNQNYLISRIPLEIDFTRQMISFRESELLSL